MIKMVNISDLEDQKSILGVVMPISIEGNGPPCHLKDIHARSGAHKEEQMGASSGLKLVLHLDSSQCIGASFQQKS